MLYTAQIEKELSKGYTQASLNYVKSLQTQNINFEMLPLGQTVHWEYKPYWIQSSIDFFSKTQSNREIVLTHITPSDLLKVKYKGSKKTIGLTTFETTRLPKWIVSGLNDFYDGLIVPSTYNKESLISSGIQIPIEVVEHAIGNWWLDHYTPKNSEPYVFGYIGGWNNRKNPMLILESFLELYPKSQENFALFLKTYTDVQKANYIEDLIKGREDIWFYNESWTEEQMAWGYSQIDCFISAHKGEGFGLNMAQANYLNKPVIFTNYSAPTEWLKVDSCNNYPVSFQTETAKVNSDLYKYFKTENGAELLWANPEKEDLISQIQRVANEKPKEAMAQQDLEAYRERFSWKNIGENLVLAIESISGLPLERI